MTNEEFEIELKKININLTKDQKNKLEKFYLLLKEGNQKMNLTRIIEKKDVYLKHFYDSLTVIKAIDLNQIHTLCDVGTGAGFPGIVLKICYPKLKVTLIDSLQKRINYLNEVIKQLDLKEIKAIHIRAEEYQGQFDCVVSRAVANIEKLLTYTMHLVKKEGIMIAMKGNIEEELNSKVKREIEKKYQIVKIETFHLPIENSMRNLIVIKKEK